MRENYNYDDNFMTLADSYKTSHWAFYPPNTSFMASYLESRGGMFDTTLWNGLQPLLKKYFIGQVITEEKIEEAYQEWGEHFGDYNVFNRAGWEYILKEHDGYLPLRIKQAPEGSVIPVSNIMAMVENTDEGNCAWLTNYVETVLLHVWFPTTVGTLSREIKKVQIKSLIETSDLTDEEINGIVSFMLHDFGFRGTSSVQSAAAGGAAHLINYMGTDTFVATRFIKQFYNTSNMTGFSIRATEHSTVMLWKEEMQMMKRLITETPEAAIVACVSDTYDIVNAVKNIWGGELRDNIMERNGRLVIRPDSGDPSYTLGVIFDILWEKFGEYGHVNSKGYRVLPPQIRVIQGDGVNYNSIKEILTMLAKRGYSTENIVFGMGGALLQKLDRDTQKFAIKACTAIIDGEVLDVQKSPMEFDKDGNYKVSFKKSKKGYMKLVLENGEYRTVTSEDPNFDSYKDELEIVFEDGQLIKEYKFQDIRDRAAISFDELKNEPELWV